MRRTRGVDGLTGEKDLDAWFVGYRAFEIVMTATGFSFDPQAYGPAVAELLLPPRECPLGPGQPNRAAEGRLTALTPEALLAGRPLVDRAMAQACLAGLWLYHDFLDESHAISQEIHTPSGSFWHGILHRREGDFENAKYWLRRVGNHPVYDPLRQATAAAAAAMPSGNSDATSRLLTQSAWDPLAFVDLCRAAQSVGHASPSEPTAALCLVVQAREWELLFDHCYRTASGRG